MAVTQLEIDLPDQLPKQHSTARGQRSLDHYLDRIAKLGRYIVVAWLANGWLEG